MAIKDITTTQYGTIYTLTNGKTIIDSTQKKPSRDKDIVEVVIANHEKFTLYRGGEIVREQGNFREQIKYDGRCKDNLTKSQLSAKKETQREISLLGMTSDEFYADPTTKEWESKHRAIHAKQKKKFRLRVRALRAKWRAQQRAIKKSPKRHNPFLRLWFQSQQISSH